jgi:DNA polymerase-1
LEKIIVSGDLDNLQLVSKETKVFVLSGVKKSILYDEKEVEKKYQGLKPEQIPDFKALVGDPSDNIPGVFGIGEKTAIDLLLKSKNLENLYKEIEEESEEAKKLKPKIRKTLLEYKEQAFLSKALVTLRKDVPISFELEKSRWGKYDQEELIKILQKFNFSSLIKRLLEIKREVEKRGNERGGVVKQNLKLW